MTDKTPADVKKEMEKLTEKVMPSKDVPQVPAKAAPKKKKIEEVPEEPQAEEQPAEEAAPVEADGNGEDA